ncbi:MAG: transporter associated domain-containing protein [Microthrixaceae bacterium]
MAARITESGRSRYPVIDGSLDDIVGVLHIKDFIRARQRGGSLSVRQLVRRVPTVAGTASAEQVLDRFRHDRTHAALVVDEHGGTLGLVTMDDVIAEVMDAEVNSAEGAAVSHDGGSLSLDGEVTLAELANDHGIRITNDEVTTIAGVVLVASSTLPPVGTTVTVDAYELTVEEMRGRKITRIRIRPADAPADHPGDGSTAG